MSWIVRIGPMVDRHSDVIADGNDPQIIAAFLNFRGVREKVTASRLRRLRIGEVLRFDLEDNTGLSVEKTSK